MSELKAFFETKQQTMIDLLTELVEIESPSKDKSAVDKMSQRVATLFDNAGASVEIHARDEVGDIVLGKWNAEADGKPILILSHMDTVWDVGAVAERPVRIEDDGRMYGPGAVDMKGGIVIALTAIQGLIERDELPDRPIWYLATSDEEIGSKHSKSLIEELAQQSALVLVTEPPTGDGSLKTWRKGTASYTLNITGKSAHAGNEPEQGINAIIEFAQQAMELNQLNDLKYGTSVSVTVVNGGGATNVIPDSVTARLDVRAMSVQAYEKVHKQLMDRMPFMPGAQVEMVRNHYRPPMKRDGEVFTKAQQIAKTAGITIREDGAGGGSDGNFTAALGIPTLDGMGAEGAGLHAPHEHILISSLAKKSALMAAIIRDW
ncbi:MAG: M20 family metallopeptidase [Chloroflexota bacterium]